MFECEVCKATLYEDDGLCEKCLENEVEYTKNRWERKNNFPLEEAELKYVVNK